MSITSSTFLGNVATSDQNSQGGAVEVQGATSFGLTISGSTFSGNKAVGTLSAPNSTEIGGQGVPSRIPRNS